MKDFLKKLWNEDRVLVYILIAAFFVRLAGVWSAFFFDEVFWFYEVKEILSGTLPGYHPPLAFFLYFVFALAGGFSSASFRMMPLAVGMLTIIVTYFFAKSLHGKRAAIISALLMAFLFYPVWMSLYIDVDGNLLALFFIAIMFAFHKFEVTGEGKWLLLSGVFLGLGMMSKYPALLAVPVLLVSGFLNSRLRNWKPLIAVFLVGALVFSAFPATCLLLNQPDAFYSTLIWGGGYVSKGVSVQYQEFLVSFAKAVFFLFQYATPLLPLLVLLAALKSRGEWKSPLMVSLAAFVLFYSFIVIGGSKSRYLSVVVPPMVIIGSGYLSVLLRGFGRRDFARAGILAVLIFLAASGLSMYGTSSSLNPDTFSLSLVRDNALFWYNGFASTPFAVRVYSVTFVMALSLGAFLLIFSRKRPLARACLVFLLSLGVGFNFFVLSQSFLPAVGPDYSRVMYDMVSYSQENPAGDINALTFSDGLLPYIGMGRDQRKSASDAEGIKEIQGRLAVIDLQLFDDPEFREARDAIYSSCREEKVFYSNGCPFGYFYNCG